MTTSELVNAVRAAWQRRKTTWQLFKNDLEQATRSVETDWQSQEGFLVTRTSIEIGMIWHRWCESQGIDPVVREDLELSQHWQHWVRFKSQLDQALAEIEGAIC